jgi:peptide/nickel transport system substrate-binding protein
VRRGSVSQDVLGRQLNRHAQARAVEFTSSRTTSMHPERIAATLACLLVAGGCAGPERSASAGEDVGGTVIIALPAEPRVLVPPLVSVTSEKQIIDQIFEPLADIGPELNTLGDIGWVPRLASSWTWSADSLSIAFHIAPGARWHDAHPVRATDVKFSMELYRDPGVGAYTASDLSNVDSVSVSDSATAVIWFHERSPEQFSQVVTALTIVPEHLLRDADRAALGSTAFARAPVGSGPFRFARWDARAAIEVVADTGYHLGRPKLDRIIWSVTPDPSSAVSSLLAEEADFYEAPLSPEAMTRISASSHLRTHVMRGLGYGFMGFNHRQPKNPGVPHRIFADRGVRLALSMALDRRGMMANVFDTLAVLNLGPFTRGIPGTDTALVQVPHDTAAAVRMLDSLGWRDTNGDGIRERAGTPLRFGLMLPVVSAPRRRYGTLIQEQLRRVGAQVDIEEVDISVFQTRLLGGQFDATLHVWSSDPTPSGIRDNWGSMPPEKRGRNVVAYTSRRADALMDSAIAEYDATRRRDLFRRAYETIIADAPAVWLYEMRPLVASHARLRPVLDRSDRWWRDLRLWSIPRGERIARDQIGLSAAPLAVQPAAPGPK